MGKAWPALDIHVPACDPQLQELVLAALDDYHPTAIQEPEDLNASQPFRAFFSATDERDRAADALRDTFGMHLFVQASEVDDGDWAARSQSTLEPVVVGRITVIPEKRAGSGASGNRTENGSIFLIIRPSMGFGTGHHATTRLMLRALQRVNIQERNVLDIGCGSGILAIAATLLGARHALAVDHDPDALTSAAENVALNAADRVHLLEGDAQDLTAQADVVLANLTGAVLERYAAALAHLVGPGGLLVVSGVMASETTVIPALEQFLTLEQVDQEEEWMCAIFAQRS